MKTINRDIIIGLLAGGATGIIFLIGEAMTDIINRHYHLGDLYNIVKIVIAMLLIGVCIFQVVRLNNKK